jgi:hypothetical protein
VDNGSSQGVAVTSSDHSHDYFVELCALSTSGGLSAKEWKLLGEHLASCAGCSELKAQYDCVVSTTIPSLAPDPAQEGHGSASDAWSLEHAEASLMARIDRENISPDINLESSSNDPEWRHARRLYAAAAGILFVAAAAAGYRIGVRHGPNTATVTATRTPLPRSAQPRLDQPVATDLPVLEEGKRHADNMEELQRQLQTRRLEVATLKEQRSGLEDELGERNADLDRTAQEHADLDRQLSLEQSNTQSLQAKLAVLTAQQSKDAAQSQMLQAQVSDLNSSLEAKDREIAENDELLSHDRDIRNLIGARDLYIAEIYDVAKTGVTQKAFGRVFYTKGKSLVFYAYDLDQQPGVKRASTFQAWGRRGTDRQQDVNLGIFYQDDQNKGRWILKSNDPVTLTQIDAVFVTVEPNGESSKPSGKPLLFTYLRMTPNHP